MNDFFQLSDRENHFAFPSFEAEPFDPRNPEKIFDDVAIAIGEIAELEREQQIFQQQRRAEPGAEAEKQHSPAVITSERLHRGVVDHLDRFA